jgi:hypothetical protein
MSALRRRFSRHSPAAASIVDTPANVINTPCLPCDVVPAAFIEVKVGTGAGLSAASFPVAAAAGGPIAVFIVTSGTVVALAAIASTAGIAAALDDSCVRVSAMRRAC